MTRALFILALLAFASCTMDARECPETDHHGNRLAPGECEIKLTSNYDPVEAYGTTRVICGCQGDAGFSTTRSTQNQPEIEPAPANE